MEHIEMVEKLREKAGITSEEAADALNRANWDMLEALVILENEGKIPPLTSSVVTTEQDPYGNAQKNTSGEYGRRYENSLGEKVKRLLQNSLTYSFIVRRHGKEILSLPVLILIVIACAMFYVSAVALLVGLLCECQYSVEKKDS